MTTYQCMVLASRPQGVVTPENFRLETKPVPSIKEGELLVRNHYLSLDPYMRMRMEDVKSYAAPQALVKSSNLRTQNLRWAIQLLACLAGLK